MRHFILILSLLLSVSVHARTILISDIDDTIKLAQIRSLKNSARYALDDSSRFLGMNYLYHAIAADNDISQVYYVSNAPKLLMKRTHTNFLRNGGFPAGVYLPRSEYSKTEHKVRTISDIINRVKPTKVILVGDNGENDAKFYARVAFEFPGVEFHQFIRDVYLTIRHGGEGTLIYPGQMFFVTPIEIALELKKAGLLAARTTTALIERIVPQIVSEEGRGREGVLAFPRFVDCKDFVWNWDDQISTYPELQDLKVKINERCN